MKSLKKLAPVGLLFLILVISGYIYLNPGIQALCEKRTDIVMSDGTDTVTAPRCYDRIEQAFKNNPSRLFYGALYVNSGDPESGDVLWEAWNEKFISLFFSQFFPFEQVSTAFIYFLMILDGLCMYLLCSYLGWSRWVSYALSFAWAFNVYTRARAKVHGGFVGTYHLPLIFLGFLLIVRGKSKRSLLAAQLALLIAGTVAHYYLVTCMFLTPLFMLYIWFQPEFRSDIKRISLRFVIAAIPLILLLASSYVFMLPPDARLTKDESIAAEVTTDGSPHVFLQVFHAYPIDYIAGDLGLIGTADLNPIRGAISDSVRENLGYGNAHERSNGIRWSIIALTIAAFIYLLKGQFKSDPVTQKNLIYFFIFGFFAFWLSMAPDVPTMWLSPSYWLYRLVPKIRVSSRAGIMVHFSALMIVGFLLSQKVKKWKWQKYLLYPGALLGLFLLDYFPLQTMPMAQVMPAFEVLKRENGPCEVGMAFPFINTKVTALDTYIMMQRMRGTDCKILNEIKRTDQLQFMTNKFPPDMNFVKNLANNDNAIEELEKLARCMPLNWILFLEPVPSAWAQNVCNHLGWKYFPDKICTAPVRNQPMQKLPTDCL